MLELPWPPDDLNPNARVHWRKLHAAKKKYKSDCGWIAKTHAPMTKFKMVFHPPCNRPSRNIDNAIAAFKAGQDGIANAWGVDDSVFEIEYPATFAEVVKGGKIILEGQ